MDTATPPAGPAAAPVPAPASSFGRLAGVLTSPGATFRSIAVRPTWAVALAVLVAISIVTSLLIFQKVDRDAYVDQLREQITRQGGQPDEDQLDRMATITLEYGPYFGPLFAVLFFFVLAGVLLLLANLAGGDVDYRRSLAVTLHAMVPVFALGSLLAVPIAFGRESVTLEEVQSGLVPSNLAAFAPEDAGPRLIAALASVDLFTLWTLALLVLGFHLVGRASKTGMAVMVAVLWLLWVGVKIALAGLQGGG